MAYLVWKQDDVLEEIDRIASKDFPPLVDFQGDIPASLKEVIDARDDGLVNRLAIGSPRDRERICRVRA